MAETAEKVDTKKADAEAAKAAEEQAKQDDADIEAYLSVTRGEALVRQNGHVDLPAFIAAREAAKDKD
jgi:hypothetical protein